MRSLEFLKIVEDNKYTFAVASEEKKTKIYEFSISGEVQEIQTLDFEVYTFLLFV